MTTGGDALMSVGVHSAPVLESRTSLVLVEELEREALAKQLHDSAVQNMVAMRFLADLAEGALAKGDTDALAARLAELREAAREGQAETRGLMRFLHGRCLTGMGLAEALEGHAAAVQASQGPVSTVAVTFQGELDPVVAVALHRVGQAAFLDAARRGAQSSHLQVDAIEGGTWILLVASDDGEVASADEPAEASALARWGLRVTHLGGRLDQTTTDGTQRVLCWLPIDPPAHGGCA